MENILVLNYKKTEPHLRLWRVNNACNCKYDKLYIYSTVGCKPLIGCFTRMFTVSAISNARDYRSSTVSTVFESRKGFGFPNSCRKTVPSTVRGPAPSNARSPILVLVLCTKTPDEFDHRSRDLLQSSDSGLILSTK